MSNFPTSVVPVQTRLSFMAMTALWKVPSLLLESQAKLLMAAENLLLEPPTQRSWHFPRGLWEVAPFLGFKAGRPFLSASSSSLIRHPGDLGRPSSEAGSVLGQREPERLRGQPTRPGTKSACLRSQSPVDHV